MNPSHHCTSDQAPVLVRTSPLGLAGPVFAVASASAAFVLPVVAAALALVAAVLFVAAIRIGRPGTAGDTTRTAVDGWDGPDETAVVAAEVLARTNVLLDILDRVEQAEASPDTLTVLYGIDAAASRVAGLAEEVLVLHGTPVLGTTPHRCVPWTSSGWALRESMTSTGSTSMPPRSCTSTASPPISLHGSSRPSSGTA